jgi:hypothetical protein
MSYDNIDKTIFFPVSKKIYNLYNFDETSLNNISIASSFCYFLSLFLLERDMKILSSSLYLLGYILSCTRYIKYENKKMITQYERVFDNITYSVSNISFIFYFLYALILKIKNKNNIVLSVILFIIMILFNSSLILSFSDRESSKTDNFYEFYKKLYQNNTEPIYKIYIEMMKYSYIFYKGINRNKLTNLGYGTYTIFIFFCILFF